MTKHPKRNRTLRKTTVRIYKKEDVWFVFRADTILFREALRSANFTSQGYCFKDRILPVVRQCLEDQLIALEERSGSIETELLYHRVELGDLKLQ